MCMCGCVCTAIEAIVFARILCVEVIAKKKKSATAGTASGILAYKRVPSNFYL